MDTKQVIARFEAERQALALMDHPNIAKVHDAGATETGRPYFVMELVTGVSITEYCDKNNLSTRDRLALFLQVCHAVQHAHQKGIIHRDIKPSNVMVTQRDGAPVPKVIDFGIAKATNQKLTEKTLFTRYAYIIGTPAYMSPEQAALRDLDIDTRSDIYSLGVLLYELLTGATPFSEEELRKAGYLEMQRVIREQEPIKPSTKLSTLGETLTDIAKHRASTPDLLTKAIRGDLDWIVMKTLEKTRDRCYVNASALVTDVQRHLNVEPILARGPGAIYRLRKFLRRHRSRVAVALVIVIPLSTMIVALATWHHNQLQLAEAESIAHENILAQARFLYSRDDYAATVRSLRSILDSKHVGGEARLLHDIVAANARIQINHYAGKIQADPEDANNYFFRARYYDRLQDREQACADMNQYAAILSQGWSSDFQFSAPENLGPGVNTLGVESAAGISTDGLSFYFVQDRVELWVSRRASTYDPWGAALYLGLLTPNDISTTVSSIGSLATVTTADGLEAYYSTQLPSGYGRRDLWVTARATPDDVWGPLVNLGPVINSQYDEHMACVSPDGLELYFCGRLEEGVRPGGYGYSDLWVTRRATRDDPWTEPENLGPTVNSVFVDGRPSISPDGLLLFFDSNRAGGFGGLDLYVTRRTTLSDPWGEPMNLGPVVNTPAIEEAARLSADGSTLYWDSDRPGGYGDNDIWQATVIGLGSVFDPNGGVHSIRQLNRDEDPGKEVRS